MHGVHLGVAVLVSMGFLIAGAVLFFIANSAGRESFRINSYLGLWSESTKHCEDCWDVGHLAARPFLLLGAGLAVINALALGTIGATMSVVNYVVMVVGGAVVVIGLAFMSLGIAHVGAKRNHEETKENIQSLPPTNNP